MNQELKKLVEGAELLKIESEKHFIPSCGWKDVKKVEIYFANGYKTFAAKNEKVDVSLYYSPAKIDVRVGDVEKDVFEFTAQIYEAIEYLKNKEVKNIEEQKELRRKELLKQLEELK